MGKFTILDSQNTQLLNGGVNQYLFWKLYAGNLTEYVQTKPLSLSGKNVVAVTLTLELGALNYQNGDPLDIRAHLVGSISQVGQNDPVYAGNYGAKTQVLCSATALANQDIIAQSTLTFVFFQLDPSNISLIAPQSISKTPTDYRTYLPDQTTSLNIIPFKIYNRTYGKSVAANAGGTVDIPNNKMVLTSGLIPNDIYFLIEGLCGDNYTNGNIEIKSYTVGVITQ